jgi:hypothetical protein
MNPYSFKSEVYFLTELDFMYMLHHSPSLLSDTGSWCRPMQRIVF